MGFAVDRNRGHLFDVADQDFAGAIEQRDIIEASQIARQPQIQRALEFVVGVVHSFRGFVDENDASASFVRRGDLQINETEDERRRRGHRKRETERNPKRGRTKDFKHPH